MTPNYRTLNNNAAIVAAKMEALVNSTVESTVPMMHKESSMNNSITNLVSAEFVTINVTVKLWDDAFSGSIGTTQIIPSTAGADAKFSKWGLSRANGNFEKTATALKAAVGAAEKYVSKMGYVSRNDIEKDDYSTIDTVNAKMIDTVCDPASFVFPVVDGIINPTLHIVNNFKGNYVGAIHTSAWEGEEVLKIKLTMENGQKIFGSLSAPMTVVDGKVVPATGWYNLKSVNGQLFQPEIMPMDSETSKGDRVTYNAEMHTAIMELAFGRKLMFSCRWDRKVDGGTRNDRFISIKAEQLIRRAGLTVEQITEEKMTVVNNIEQSRKDAATVKISKEKGTWVDTTEKVLSGGEIREKFETAIMLNVNGVMVKISSNLDVMKFKGTFTVRAAGFKGQKIGNPVELSKATMDQVQIWSKNGRVLTSIVLVD